jgi:hypothetical protein
MKEENTYKIIKGVKAPERKYRTSNSKLSIPGVDKSPLRVWRVK